MRLSLGDMWEYSAVRLWVRDAPRGRASAAGRVIMEREAMDEELYDDVLVIAQLVT